MFFRSEVTKMWIPDHLSFAVLCLRARFPTCRVGDFCLRVCTHGLPPLSRCVFTYRGSLCFSVLAPLKKGEDIGFVFRSSEEGGEQHTQLSLRSELNRS